MKLKTDENLPVEVAEVLRAAGHDSAKDKRYILSLIPAIVDLLEAEPIGGHLWIVEEGRIRVRE